MRRITTEVVFETGKGCWNGDQRLKTAGLLLSHIKTEHTDDGHITGCRATIAFRKIDETERIERYKAFFPPLLDGKNILAALEKNLCPFCEIERAKETVAACRRNEDCGHGPIYTPENSEDRYEIDAVGRLSRQRASASGGLLPREWFDFTKGFWFTDPDAVPVSKPDR